MNTFVPDEDLRVAVEQKNKAEAQKCIRAYTHSDPYNKRKDAIHAVSYAIERGLDVFDDNDETITMVLDKSLWNYNYLDSITTGLFRNFSEARFKHWAEVAEHMGAIRENEKKINKKEGQPKNAGNPQEEFHQKGLIAGLAGLIILIVIFLIKVLAD